MLCYVKKTVGMTLTKSGNKYEPKFGWVIGTTKLKMGLTYRVIVEVYTTDKVKMKVQQLGL